MNMKSCVGDMNPNPKGFAIVAYNGHVHIQTNKATKPHKVDTKQA